jgi:tetratricopeptide (TPR) repeat protein
MRSTLITLFLLSAPVVVGGAQSLKISESIESLESKARLDSNDAAAQFNLALGYWSKKRYDDALAPLRRAIAIDPEFAAAYFAMALVPVADGSAFKKHEIPNIGYRFTYYTAVDSVWKEFDRQVRHAFDIDPLVDTRIEASVEWFGGFQDAFERGFHDYQEGKYEPAIAHFDDFVKDVEPHADRRAALASGLWYRALAELHLTHYDAAIRDLGRLVETSQRQESGDSLVHNPFRTNEYRYVLAFAQQRAGHPNDAIRLYQDVLGDDIGFYTAHVRLAEIYESHQMWDQAVLERQRAVEASPDNPSLELYLGETLANAGRWGDAEQPLQTAERANPRDSRIPYFLARVEQQLGKSAAARDGYNRFIAIAPSRFAVQISDAKQRLAALH